MKKRTNVSTFDVFFKTSPFIKEFLKRFGLYFLSMAMILTILATAKYFLNNGFVSLVTTIASIATFIIFLKVGKRYFTFYSKASYIAIVVEYLYTGVAKKKGMVSRGKGVIDDFFESSSNASIVDSQNEKALKEVNRWILKVSSFILGVPTSGKLADFIYKTSDIIVPHLRDCILTYMFVGDEDNYWKASSEGIALYVQNWKSFANEVFKFIYISIGVKVVLFFIFSAIFSSWFGFFGGIYVLLLTLGFVSMLSGIFISPILSIISINKYIEFIEEEEVSVDVCKKLANISPNYKQLIINIVGEEEIKKQKENNTKEEADE